MLQEPASLLFGSAFRPKREALRPPEANASDIWFPTLSRRGDALAWLSEDEVESRIKVCLLGAAKGRTIRSLLGATLRSLRWSPSGEFLCYALTTEEGAHQVGWVNVASKDHGQVAGAACAWAPGKDVLLVADPERACLKRVDPKDGQQDELSPLQHTDYQRPPQLAVAPMGYRIAFVCYGLGDEPSSLWAMEDVNTPAQLVTELPGGDASVHPFWSPHGHTLGFSLIMPAQHRSAIFLLPHLRGDGVCLHQHERLDVDEAPVWTADARAIVHYCATDSSQQAAQNLVFIDPKKGEELASVPAPKVGPLRFEGAKTLLVEVTSFVERLTFR